MSEHYFRPRLVRHVFPGGSNSGGGGQFYSNTLPLMLASASNRVAIANAGAISTAAVNDNMAFDDRSSLESYGLPQPASSAPTPLSHCSLSATNSPDHRHGNNSSYHHYNTKASGAVASDHTCTGGSGLFGHSSKNHNNNSGCLKESSGSSGGIFAMDSPHHHHHQSSRGGTVSSDRAYDQVLFDILKVDAENFAKQICLIELDHFRAIQPEEFLSFKWNGKDKMEHAPNIVASTKWFNQINFWVQREILNVNQVNKRAEVLAHFIKIAKKLIEQNNLYSAMAIVSALQVECIYRLKQTWAALANKDRSSYRRLDDLFNQEDNYRRLREHTAAMRLPCIPYLGIYLSDLTYINVAHPSQGEMEPQNRLDKINNILRVITDFQQSEYPFTRVEYIYRYLQSQQYIEELQKFLEDDNYKSSKALEPDPYSSHSHHGSSHHQQSGPSAGPPVVSMTVSGGCLEGKWSPPRWGDACTRLIDRSYSVGGGSGGGGHLCKHGLEECPVINSTSDAGLPQPLLKVSLPTRFSSTSPLTTSTATSNNTNPTSPASPSAMTTTGGGSTACSLLKQALQNHQHQLYNTSSSTASSSAGSVRGAEASGLPGRGDWSTCTLPGLLNNSHRKAQSLSGASFHIGPSGSGGTAVNRSASLCCKELDDFAPKLHLLDDSLLDGPVVHRSSTQAILPGGPFTRRPTDISDLSLAAVAAVAKDALATTLSSGSAAVELKNGSLVDDTANTTLLETTTSFTSQEASLVTIGDALNNHHQHSSRAASASSQSSTGATRGSSRSSSLPTTLAVGGGAAAVGSSLRMVCHGCLQRKTVMKRGVKSRFSLWHRFWLVLLESPDNLFLVYFEPNSLRAVRREEFRNKESQVQPLRGFILLRKESTSSSSASSSFARQVPAHSNSLLPPTGSNSGAVSSFRLIDPTIGTTYKFRTIPNAPQQNSQPLRSVAKGTEMAGSNERVNSTASTSSSASSSGNSGECQLRFQAAQWYEELSRCLRRLDMDLSGADLIQLTDS